MTARIDTVFLPADLDESLIVDRAVVVLDVLRATTSMTAALAAGAERIEVFGSLDEVRAAAAGSVGPVLMAGEEKCIKPVGFDFGNSPGDFSSEKCADRAVYMSTTNGTRALVAARSAPVLLAGALINAPAVARFLVKLGRDVTLVCSGTEGRISTEDVIGAGAIADAFRQLEQGVDVAESDTTQIARAAFRGTRTCLLETLSNTTGGRNVIAAGLTKDVEFAARVGVFNLVAVADPNTLVLSARLS